jgi:hypothetical protein
MRIFLLSSSWLLSSVAQLRDFKFKRCEPLFESFDPTEWPRRRRRAVVDQHAVGPQHAADVGARV